MIDASLAKKVAAKSLKDARKFFGIDPAWDIKLASCPLEEGTHAEVVILLPYRRAGINYDPGQARDARGVRAAVAHEVAHLVLAEFELFRDLVQASGEWSESLAVAYKYADERATVMLEQLFMRERPQADARKRESA
jgi:hypothetical protein